MPSAEYMTIAGFGIIVPHFSRRPNALSCATNIYIIPALPPLESLFFQMNARKGLNFHITAKQVTKPFKG
jgi:hypothetical protein